MMATNTPANSTADHSAAVNAKTVYSVSEAFCVLINRESKELGEALRRASVDYGRRELNNCVVLIEAAPNAFDYGLSRCWAKPIMKDSRRGVYLSDPAGPPNIFHRVSAANSKALAHTMGEAVGFVLDCVRKTLSQGNDWEDTYVPVVEPKASVRRSVRRSEIRVVIHVMEQSFPDSHFMLAIKDAYYVRPLPDES